MIAAVVVVDFIVVVVVTVEFVDFVACVVYSSRT